MNKPYQGVSHIYDEVRPSYPIKLIDDIIEITQLTKDDRILEVGAGTGKATVQFLEKGLSIHAVELDEEMANRLKAKSKNHPNLTVDVSSFEEWNSDKLFHLIFSAQAFHWINPMIKYQKCFDLLEPEGYLVLFWYQSLNDNETTKLIDQKMDEIYQQYFKNYTVNNPFSHPVVDRKIEIIESKMFEILLENEYEHQIENNANEYLKVKKSIPQIATCYEALDELQRNKLDNELMELINHYGGLVTTSFTYTLYITKKAKGMIR